MKIYTKTGDQGMTSLFGGLRVKKTHIQIEAFGSIDELNAVFGVIRAQIEEKMNFYTQSEKDEKGISSKILKEYENILKYLIQVQIQLFHLGSHLASANEEIKKKLRPLDFSEIEKMEKIIDAKEKKLPKIKNFILPGGNPIGASFHLARTISRRVERVVLKFNEQKALNPFILKYFNRLSDLLFIFARMSNYLEGKNEILWI